MAKIKYEKWGIELFKETEEGRKYLEYNEKIGGEPISLMVPFGYPSGVEEMGGPMAVYDECIKRNVMWEKLLSFCPPEDAKI